jgi:hypothetical protein
MNNIVLNIILLLDSNKNEEIDVSKISVVELPSACLTDGESLRTVCRPHFSPIATLHLASELREKTDHDVRLVNMKGVDPEITEYGEIQYGNMTLKKLRVGTPFGRADDFLRDTDYLVLSNNFTQNANVVTDFAKYARKVNPGITILAGGTDVGTRAQHYLERGIDYAFIGEADVTLLRFFNLEDGYRGEKDRTVRMKTLDDIPDPDKWIPYDYGLVDLSLSKQSSEGSVPPENTPFQFLVTSQGCHQACAFCTNYPLRGGGLRRKIDKKAPIYRPMSNRQLATWLDGAKAAGIKSLGIGDDALLTRLFLDGSGKLDEDRAHAERPTEYGHGVIKEYMGMLAARGFNIEFPNGLQMSLLYDNPELTKTLLDENTFRLYWPFDDLSFPEGEKPRWSKQGTWEQELLLAEQVAEISQTPYFTFGVIIGFPYEDKASLGRVLERSKQIKGIFESHGKQTAFRYFLAQPLPGTRCHDQTVRDELFVYDIGEHPELISFETTATRTNSLEPHELVAAREEMTEEINGQEYVKYMFESGQIYFPGLAGAEDQRLFTELPYVKSKNRNSDINENK